MTQPTIQTPPPLTADTVRQWADTTLEFLHGINEAIPGSVDGELLVLLDGITTNTHVRQMVTQKLSECQQKRLEAKAS